MKRLQICQAMPTAETKVDGVVIEISLALIGDTFLTEKSSPKEYESVFNLDAMTLEDALHSSLPGGTYDRLLGRMLARKSSHFVVSHGS